MPCFGIRKKLGDLRLPGPVVAVRIARSCRHPESWTIPEAAGSGNEHIRGRIDTFMERHKKAAHQERLLPNALDFSPEWLSIIFLKVPS